MEQMEVLNLASAILGKSDNNPLHLEMGARVVEQHRMANNIRCY